MKFNFGNFGGFQSDPDSGEYSWTPPNRQQKAKKPRKSLSKGKALICTNNDLGFQERFVSTLRNQYLRTFLAQVCRTEERIRDMYCVYIVQGMLAIVTLWLDTGMRETPEQIAQLGGDFIMRGVKGLR